MVFKWKDSTICHCCLSFLAIFAFGWLKKASSDSNHSSMFDLGLHAHFPCLYKQITHKPLSISYITSCITFFKLQFCLVTKLSQATTPLDFFGCSNQIQLKTKRSTWNHINTHHDPLGVHNWKNKRQSP